MEPSRARRVKSSCFSSVVVSKSKVAVLKSAADCLALSPPNGHGAERGAWPKGGAGVSFRSAPDRAAVRDFLGLSSPCLPFLLVGDVNEGSRPSTNVGLTISAELDFRILRAGPLVMLVPKSCIFLTDRLSLRLSELLRGDSSGDGMFKVAATVDVEAEGALDAPLTCDKKLDVRPRLLTELADECPIGRTNCLLLDLWLFQNCNRDSSVGKCGSRRFDCCSCASESDQLMLGTWVLLKGIDMSAAVSSRDRDALRGIALPKSRPCMCSSSSSLMWQELNGVVEECTVCGRWSGMGGRARNEDPEYS